jgi:tetratricopeptide (TPR) repeat protein
MRRALLYALTLLVPVAALVLLEIALRLFWAGGSIPAFEVVNGSGGTLQTPARGVARRYFAAETDPPAPPTDVFASAKPSHAFRVFVLGESSAAGFPYPHNGTFSRLLRDALHDVLPDDSVEVVNVGIAATNSYTIADLTPAVIAQHPDAVLIYAGHNEYYGALGVGSAVRVGSSPAIVRAYLAAEHLRTFMALRYALGSLQRRLSAGAPRDSTVATFMETIARDQEIMAQGPAFLSGFEQFDANITSSLRQFRGAAIPVYVASIESNVREQPPFASPSNGPANAAFLAGHAALTRGDTAAARPLLLRARDLDVIRFRAPAALNDVIRRVAKREGAHYVPVAERLDSIAPAGLPGSELFLEHVHPNARGYAEIGRGFFEALRADGFLGRRADLARLGSWDAYRSRMELTAFDERIAEHTVRTITTRWPFVERRLSRDYRGTYRPHGVADSLALLVSRGGISWGEAKLRLAAAFERAGHPDSALAEYRGLVRDAPYRELPNRLAGRTLLALGRAPDATPFLERAARLEPSPEAVYLLGVAALQRKDFDVAIATLDQAVRLAPSAPAPLYQLSLAFGLSKNIGPARAAAARAAQLDPGYPGLAEWMRVLGMRAP